MGRPNTTTHQVLMLSAALSLVSNTCIAPQVYAISMPGASKKVSTFQLPAADKIDESDLQATDEAKKLPDLSPLSLPKDRGKKNNGDGAAEKSASTDGAGAEQSRGTADGEGGKDVLNGNITTSTFVPKGPLEGDNSALLAPTSVKGAKSGSTGVSKLGGNLMEQARSVNAAPLPLIKTDEEASKEADEQSELEREQLTGLWEAALTRSPEINFVIQKLMPSSDPSKVTSFMMRLLSSAVAAGACSAQMMMPSMGTYAASQGSMQVMGNLLGVMEGNNAKKAKLNQSEQIQMFMMVRATADKLVDHYRNYKICHKELHRANTDFEDFKRVAADARKTVDAAKQLDIEYTLRKQQREIETIGQNLSKHRQNLVDMSGPDAVAKLDQQIDEEFKKLHPELNTDSAVAQQGTDPGAATQAKSGDVDPAKTEVTVTESDKPKQLAGESSEQHFKLPL